jgi:hypothetical protein
MDAPVSIARADEFAAPQRFPRDAPRRNLQGRRSTLASRAGADADSGACLPGSRSWCGQARHPGRCVDPEGADRVLRVGARATPLGERGRLGPGRRSEEGEACRRARLGRRPESSCRFLRRSTRRGRDASIDERGERRAPGHRRASHGAGRPGGGRERLGDALAPARERQDGRPLAIAPNAHPDDRDVSCTSRDHCVSPTEAGTRIYKSYVDNYNECTRAFHVVLTSGDVQFVTAGHCGYGGSNTWLIKDGTSNGMVIGTEQASLYHSGGQDILRISLPVSQKSHHMYGDSRVYGGSGACPITGQAACASRGHSDVVDCGTVRTTWTSWYSNTANPDIVVWGGDMNDVSAIPGDSGSPIFDKLDSTQWGTVGVLDTSSAGFAVLCKAASGLGLTGRAY